MDTTAVDPVVLLLEPTPGRPLVDSTAVARPSPGLSCSTSLAGVLNRDGERARARLRPAGPAPLDPASSGCCTP